MNDEEPGGISGKSVLIGFLAILAMVGGGIIFISRDVDDKARKAKELEEKLGREVGPEDSPKHQKKLRDQKARE